MPLPAPRSWLLAVSCGVLALLPSVTSAGMTPLEVREFNSHMALIKTGQAGELYNVGCCYADGVGVAKDEIEAYAYWSLRGVSGRDDAKYGLYVLRHELSPADILRGERRTKSLQAEVDALVAAGKSDKDDGSSESPPDVRSHYYAAAIRCLDRKDYVETVAYLSLRGMDDRYDATYALSILKNEISPEVISKGQQRARELQKELDSKSSASKSSRKDN